MTIPELRAAYLGLASGMIAVYAHQCDLVGLVVLTNVSTLLWMSIFLFAGIRLRL